jgi:hypothetical protein
VIALCASLVLALYLVIPSLLFRALSRFFIPLRIVAGTPTQEVARAFLTAAMPFLLAWAAIHQLPAGVVGMPLQAQATGQDYKLVASCLYSEQTFRDSKQAFWDSFGRVARRQSQFLGWYYVLVMGEGLLVGLLAGHYGRFKKNRVYSWMADKVLLPSISEWHPLLTPFVFADKSTVVRADVLTTGDNLYRGRVSQYFLDPGGRLSGLILTDMVRFDRRTYLQDKDAHRGPDPRGYWKEIPGAKLYIFADKILNLNLNYESPEPSARVVEEFLRKYLATAIPPFHVEFKRPTETPAESDRERGDDAEDR